MGRRTSEYEPQEFTRAHPEEFIRTWQGADSLRAVCTKLGMRKSAAKLRAYRYRKLHGVPLKLFDAGPAGAGATEKYWRQLAQLAADLAPHTKGTSATAPQSQS